MEILKIIVFGKKIFKKNKKKKNTDSRVYIYIYKFGWVHLDELVVIKKKKMKLILNVELPSPPVTAFWILNVANAGHLADKHWHRAVLLYFLCKNSLCPKSFMCCHSIRPTKTVAIELFLYLKSIISKSIM